MKNTKKILIIDPYLDVFGGGEKHILSIAKILHDAGGSIIIAWKDKEIMNGLESRFNFGFKNIHIDTQILKKGSFDRSLAMKRYDYCFYVTDGSYFFSTAKQSIVFCMYPQKALYRKTFLNSLKWKNFKFIANSAYTAKFIAKWTEKDVAVIYPFIDNELINNYIPIAKKEKIILSVGRFFSHLHSKRQDIIIEAFNKLQQEYKMFKDFRLILVGGLKEEDKDYFKKIESMAMQNKSITLLPNVSRSVLLDYYKRSLFYWHAAGFGIDESKHPEQVEHLGITPLEAMATRCVVFCHNSGGPKEYITEGKDGYLYNTLDELIEKTEVAYGSLNEVDEITAAAKKSISEKFSYEVFKDQVINHFTL